MIAPACDTGRTDHVRIRVRARGLVQGVGFRPFVYGLARRYALTGWVRNDDAGVLLEVQGLSTVAFLRALRTELPPLARIDALEIEVVGSTEREAEFQIRESACAARVSTGIGADAAPCVACLLECFDPEDRRHRYPFLNCTHCGPRFTITRDLPYDRAQTSMAPFAMCAACEREYHDPGDRRFHAQATACPACGPRLARPVDEIVARLRRGGIVALKGLGGFHVTCDARNRAAVERLRRAKQRDGKPFAVMVAGVASARRLVRLDGEEAALLGSSARPIVLARRLPVERLAPAVAPDLAWLGVMLPSSPLHYLLFHEAAGRPSGVAWLDEPQELALVMTSANPGGEPLVVDDADAGRRLAGICDVIVGHDREVVVRCDDPVVRVVAAHTAHSRCAKARHNGVGYTRTEEFGLLRLQLFHYALMLLGQFLLALSTRSVCCLLVLIDEFVVVVHLCTSVHGSLDALRCEVGRDSASQ